MARTRKPQSPGYWVREEARLNRSLLESKPDPRSFDSNPGAAPQWSVRHTATLAIVCLLTGALMFLLTLAIP